MQFNDTVLAVMPTVGAAKLFVTVVVPLEVHPLDPVTVTLKVPADVTLMLEAVLPLLHK